MKMRGLHLEVVHLFSLIVPRASYQNRYVASLIIGMFMFLSIYFSVPSHFPFLFYGIIHSYFAFPSKCNAVTY